MNTNDLLNTYTNEVEIIYKEEKYLVRDNGAVYRKQKASSRKRPLDEIWTFGKMNKQKGYMFISPRNSPYHSICLFGRSSISQLCSRPY
jgi:hypothetical protein